MNAVALASFSPGKYQRGFSSPAVLADSIRKHLLDGLEKQAQHGPVKQVFSSPEPGKLYFESFSFEESLRHYMTHMENRSNPTIALRNWLSRIAGGPGRKFQAITCVRKWKAENPHLFPG